MHPATPRRVGVAVATAVAAIALLAVACSDSSSGATGTTEADQPACPTTGDEFETARLYVEHNATDEDTGVHGLFGGVAWSSLCISDPQGELILTVSPLAQLGDLTLSDLFFESREPPNDEFSLDDLRSDFPEGEYTIAGVDFEGTPRVGAARFTHDFAAEPEITAPRLGEEPEEAPEVPAGGLTIRWEPVIGTVDGSNVEITAYEVIVTKEEHEDPDGFSRPVYDVHVPPSLTALTVPSEFFEPDTIYELEVIAIEVSGNQTITVGFFRTQ